MKFLKQKKQKPLPFNKIYSKIRNEAVYRINMTV